VDPLEALAARTGTSLDYVQTLSALGRLHELFDDDGGPIGTPTPEQALRQLARRRAKWADE
jgi:hypothetical protein